MPLTTFVVVEKVYQILVLTMYKQNEKSFLTKKLVRLLKVKYLYGLTEIFVCFLLSLIDIFSFKKPECMRGSFCFRHHVIRNKI